MAYVRVLFVVTDAIIMQTAIHNTSAKLVCTGLGKMSARPTARLVIAAMKTFIAAQRTSAGLPLRTKRKITKRHALSCTPVKWVQFLVGR